MHARTLMLICLLIAGCESSGPTTSDKDLMHLEYRDVVAALADATPKKPVLVVDLRSPAQFEKGHLPGAVNVPLGEVNPNDARFRDAAMVILYHEEFRGAYPDGEAKKLLTGGVKNVYSYAGGYRDWVTRQAEGGPPAPKE